MLENTVENGERPEDLVIYGALAKAARDWPSYDRLVAALRTLEEGRTLVVQSGKPVGVFATSPAAPLVLMATSNLVGRWATAFGCSSATGSWVPRAVRGSASSTTAPSSRPVTRHS